MALVTGEDLAEVLDLVYADAPATFDQVADAADDIVASLITVAAYILEPPACREAAISVAVEAFQARTASGGQAVATDFSPGPYRLSIWMTRRVMALLAPYLDVKGMIG
jgi:hypothetical protein